MLQRIKSIWWWYQINEGIIKFACLFAAFGILFHKVSFWNMLIVSFIFFGWITVGQTLQLRKESKQRYVTLSYKESFIGGAGLSLAITGSIFLGYLISHAIFLSLF